MSTFRRASDSNISLVQLRDRLDDPSLTIVDVRPLPAYNGWRTAGTPRGGHIPGAAAFPSAWLGIVDDLEVERLLHSKGILPSRDVVLYGDQPEDGFALRTRLAELGHARTRIYEGGWVEWAGDTSLPIDRLPNYEKLVHPEWLRQLLDGGRPEAAPAGRYLLFHVNFGVPEEYEENHLPGAPVPRYEPARESDRLEPPDPKGARGRAVLARDHPRHHGHPLRSRY